MKCRWKWYRILLVSFFGLMAVSTAASRIYDSISVPKVLTAYPKRKSVETLISGTGTVRENHTAFCGVYPGIRVESVEVSPGSQVKPGDELFCFQAASLQEKRAELETELEKARLNLERTEISAEAYEQVSQTELAQRELKLAQQELEEGRQNYQIKWGEHLADLKNLEDDYLRKKALSDEELLLEQDRQLGNVDMELDTARASRDAELEEADREIEDLEEEIKAAEELGEEGKEAVSQLKKKLSRAREDKKSLEEQWRLQIRNIQEQYDLLDFQSDRIWNGETSSQEALKENYEAAVKQEEALWQQEEEKLKALEKEAEDAQWNLDIAARQDEYARLTASQKKRLSQVDRRLGELEIAGIERRISQLDAVIAAEGKVRADVAGTVIDQELTAGTTTTGEERLSIAYGNRILEGEFDKEGQSLSEGDLLSVSIPGGSQKAEAKIDSLNLLGEDTGVLRAELGELNLPVGTVTSYECRKISDIYQKVIPLAALRKDMAGYYCLAVRTRKTVMGEEFWAERVNLTVLCQGDQEAAVEGGILDSDRLISAGNQVITPGMRVRPVEELKG